MARSAPPWTRPACSTDGSRQWLRRAEGTADIAGLTLTRIGADRDGVVASFASLKPANSRSVWRGTRNARLMVPTMEHTIERLGDYTTALTEAQLRQAGIPIATASALLGHYAREDPAMLEYFMTARRISRPVQLLVKAAVAAGLVSDSTWGGPLALTQPMVAAFLSAVDREWTLPQLGAVKVPSTNVVGATQTATASAYWVGEAAPKPITSLAFAAMSLTPRKVVADLALSEELFTAAVPDALALVERGAVTAVATALETALWDPANAGLANIKPPSLTNGLVAITPAGDFPTMSGRRSRR